MKILPQLNLNKHPQDVENGSLISAVDMMCSNDNSVLQTEHNFTNHHLTELFKEIASDDFQIISCIPCNNELVVFVTNNGVSSIYRYNEKADDIKHCCDFIYSGGTIIGTFTYNFNNLIIAFSEYFEDDSKNIPLKTINLGVWDKDIDDNDISQLNDYDLHPCNPNVIIPAINTSYVKGICYKGWYFIFVRYKISDNTYTQWFNTNECIFVDTFTNSNLYKSFVSPDVNSVGNTKNTWCSFYNYISDDTDISLITLQCDIQNKDTKYDYYQLGFIINRKDSTKCYRTEDISIDNETFIFDNKLVVEEGAEQMINTHINYYNVKSLATVKNRLYIGNYKENIFEKDIVNSLKNISLNIRFEAKDTTSGLDAQTRVEEQYKCTVYCNVKGQSQQYHLTAALYNNNIDGMIYYTAARSFIINQSQDDVALMMRGKTITISYYSNGENIIETVNSSDVIIAPFESCIINGQPNQGKIFVRKNGELIEHNPNGSEIRLFNIVSKTDTSHIEGTIAMPWTNCDFTHDEIDTDKGEIGQTTTVLEQVGLRPNNPYNFFIHFVDKYGAITDGFNIGCFNLTTSEDTVINKINDTILVTPTTDSIYTAYFTLSEIPGQYVAWFVSYEKVERYVKYTGFIGANGQIEANNTTEAPEIVKETVSATDLNGDPTDPWEGERGNSQYFISNKLNFADSITTDFDIIRIYDTTIKRYSTNKANICKFVYNKTNGNYEDKIITSKHLLVADSYNNIGGETKLQLNINGVVDNILYTYIVELINSDKPSVYNNTNKILIPCSCIQYGTGSIEINTKDCFYGEIHAYDYQEESYWNDAIKYFQTSGNSYPLFRPVYCKIQNAFVDIPWESLQINNKPTVVFYPNTGLNTDNEYEKSFIIGTIIEAKNTVDLFQQKNNTVGDACPKSLTNYYETKNYIKDYPKTIRRSVVLQDESNTNSWRQFNIEDYKNIIENKGSITKLITIGYYFLVHCEHSLFLFDSTNTLQTNNQDKLQLANTDIWEIAYKEVLTSDLGYAGIQQEYAGISGNFGYIFFDSDRRRFYRYDNNNISLIDSDIHNFIRKLHGYVALFADDKQNNRLIIKLTDNKKNRFVLSYNYNINKFVSSHSYDFLKGYSTKENIYIIGNNAKEFDYFGDKYSLESSVGIMINTGYVTMKTIDAIQYKVEKVKDNPVGLDYSTLPVEGIDDKYSGDLLRVYSTHCDTGLLDITFGNTEDTTVNQFGDYLKPHWRLGNWHFNCLRNKLTDYIAGNITAFDSSRVFGNWFVVQFVFRTSDRVELESIDAKFSNIEYDT